MTPDGFSRLTAELKRLKTVERPAVIKSIAEARAHGDLSENAEYHAARERQGFIEGRVLELEDKLSRAEVIDIKLQSGSRVMFGARASLLAGVVSISIALGLGVPIGLFAGYGGKWIDAVIGRITDAMLACPFLILAIALAAFLGPSLENAMIAIGITATPIFVRLTRGQVMAVKVEDYVEAARAVGNPPLRIAVRHILPNIMPALIVQATISIATAIIAEASLSFLGLGQQPPAPSWGSMLNTAQRFLTNAPWMAIWPGLAIFLVVLSFNILGDGLRDALDPRER